MPPIKRNSLAEFWQYVDKLGDNDCWLWTRSVQTDGYGQYRLARKTHCKRGHAFTPENTYAVSGGGRGCRERRRTYDARRAQGVA